ncbi:MAG: lipopolysaccharide biosynthesis protein [Marmoricola sp.]|nr:lipopolysaccharide biosynthesis protein [Marmoricola sp.]
MGCMAPTTTLSRVGLPRPDVASPLARRTARWGPQWPLALLFLGFPLWWVAGLSGLVPLFVAVPMALQLTRAGVVWLPRGFGWWLLFLVWVTLGIAVLWVNAPDAIPGGGAANRLLVFGYRLGWYVACTVVMLWVGNLSKNVLSDARAHWLVGSLFIVAALGGLLGYLEPTLQFRSAIEYLLPHGIRQNSFVASIVHPEVADIETVLGHPEPRPKAPFAFTNSWGSGLSLTLIFFVAMLHNSTRLAKIAAVCLAGVAAIPVIYSLNRGLWASLVAGVVGVAVVLFFKGRTVAFLAMVTAAVVALALLMASPLGGLYQQRLEHQHSNERRGQLLTQTASSVTHGSPVLGFGSTRQVQGSFASIAGASTPDCHACGVPPLGTQGHLWLVLFSQGWFGLVFFLSFMLLALSRSWRCRSPNEVVCTFAIAFFLMQFPVYDSLGMPLFIVMIAIGLVWREQREAALVPMPHTHRTAAQLAAELRGVWPMVLALCLVGGVVGSLGALAASHPTYRSTVSIALTPAPVYLSTGAPVSGVPNSVTQSSSEPRDITIDTEAALLLSESSLVAASSRTGTSTALLRKSIKVSAVPNTHVLQLSVQARRPAEAAADSAAVAAAYLATRQTYLDQRRSHLLGHLQDELQNLVGFGATVDRTRDYLLSAISQLLFTRTTVGQVIGQPAAQPVPRQIVVVAAASGVALGLLTAVTLMSLFPQRRRYDDE